MKHQYFLVILLSSFSAHAQMAGYLYDKAINPEIIRNAAECSVTGACLGNLGGASVYEAGTPQPTAAEIASEIRAQEKYEKSRNEQRESDRVRSELVWKVRARIKSAYEREFGS